MRSLAALRDAGVRLSSAPQGARSLPLGLGQRSLSALRDAGSPPLSVLRRAESRSLAALRGTGSLPLGLG
ncbi:hypothetical protein [Streptomyces sp. NPDC004291]